MPRFYFFLQSGNNFGERLGALIAFAAMADGNSAGFRFFRTDHEHVGNFLELRVANFGGQLFVAVVEVSANAVAFESVGDMFGVVGDFFADWTNLRLNGREPERESAGVMFDKDAEETFDGTEQRAVDH